MTQDLIDAATTAVDEQRLERAQALALIAQAAALDSMAESLARIAEHIASEAAIRAVGTTARDEFYG